MRLLSPKCRTTNSTILLGAHVPELLQYSHLVSTHFLRKPAHLVEDYDIVDIDKQTYTCVRYRNGAGVRTFTFTVIITHIYNEDGTRTPACGPLVPLRPSVCASVGQ